MRAKFLSIILAGLIVFAACQRQGPAGPPGPAGPQGPQGPAGASCTITQLTNGALVACTDGSQAIVSNGQNGSVGATGPAGKSIVFQTASIAAGSTCSSGGQVIMIATDDAGTGTWTSSDSNQQNVTLCNGSNASLPEFTPSIAITPCGPNSSSYKEALLGLTGGGVYSEIITNLNDDSTIRNALLPDGGYYDTDDSQCNFTISTGSGNSRSVSWNGSTHNGSGPFSPGSASYSPSTFSWTASYGPIGD